MKTVRALMNHPPLLEHRKPRKDHLHIHARIEVRSEAVRDVLVLIADAECSAVGVDDLDAAAEIEGEVEAGGAGYGDLFVEVEEASGSLREWLRAAVAAEVELQADRRQAPGVYALASLGDHET